LSTNYGPKNYSILEKFVEGLPSDHRFFVELRHDEWFSNLAERERIFELFSKHNVGWAFSETSGLRNLVHMELSTPELFLRFVGHGGALRDHDFARVDEWVDRISEWVDRGLEKVYFFIHQHDEQDSPVLASYVIDQLNRRFGAGLKRVEWKP
jgi:uncharacterized protein YecE (DUF72 family)